MNWLTKIALIACASAGAAFPAWAGPMAGTARTGATATPAPTPAPRPTPMPMVPYNAWRNQMQRRLPLLKDPDAYTQDYRDALRVVRCVERYHPRQVRQLLKSRISSWTEARSAGDLLSLSGGCGGDDLKVSIRILRGAAAESMLDNLATADPDKATAVSAARARAFDETMPEVDRKWDKESEGIQRLVECQVILAPGLARKLMKTEPGSSAEDRSRTAVAAASPACGTVNVPSDADQLIYRIYLAQAVYAWSLVGSPSRYS
jgi:hypothetical protein